MTSKERIEILLKYLEEDHVVFCGDTSFGRWIKSIQNDLEVLEILKKKPHVGLFFIDKLDYPDYCNRFEYDTNYYEWANLDERLTEEEFNKVKEWLKSE